MAEVKTYEIGGKTYEQRELVLGQWRQLQALLNGLEIPAIGGMTQRLVAALEESGRLDKALAVVLTPEGTTNPREKDLDALAAELEFSITGHQVAEVINDFFTCNRVSSILNYLARFLVRLAEVVAKGVARIPSSKPASCSPEGTGPSETPSSGEPAPDKPSTGSGTGNGS